MITKQTFSLVFIFSFLIFQVNKSRAQTALSPGDISFIGFNTNNDAFSIVTFVNLCPGTVFLFTDNPYRNSTGFCTSGEEFCLTFSVTTTIPAGTKITYTDASYPTVGGVSFSPAVGAATVVYSNTGTAGTNNGFNADGDNGFIFQGSYASPSFVCAIKNSGPFNSAGTVSCAQRNDTELPSSLTLGQNALVGCVDIGMRYNCTTLTGTASTLRTSINNLANWTCSGSSVALPPPCSFTVTNVSNPLPIVGAVTSPGVICNGTSAALTASGATTYTWSANAGSVTTQTASVSPSTTTTYTVTGSVLGCRDTQTIVVQVNPLPTLIVTPASPTICNGQSTVLSVGGATTYSWSANAGSVITNTVSLSPTTNTTYTISGTALGCTSSQTVLVNVTNLPTINVTSLGSICSGQSITLTGVGAATYTWSPNAVGVNTSTVSVSPTTTTTYTLSGTQNGCTNSETHTVNVTSQATIAISQSQPTVCAGQSVVLSASGATDYVWSSNAGSAITNTVSVTPAGTTTYSVTGSTGSCSGTQSISVTVVPLPVISISTTQSSICSGQATLLNASGADTYTWSSNAGNVTNDTVSVFPTTTTTYTVTGDSLGCTALQTVTINVSTPPIVSITASQTAICSGQSAVLTANGASNYVWSSNAGSATTDTVSVFPTGTTTYTVTVDSLGCTSFQTVTINVSITPIVSITASQTSICSGQSAVLTANGASNYVWSSNAGSATTDTVSVFPTGTTTYTVIGKSATCTNEQTITVSVNALPVLLAISGQTVCEGNTVNSIVFNANPGTVVGWSNSNTNIGIPATGSGDINGYTTPAITTTESAVITVIPIDVGTGCIGLQQTFSVIIHPSPEIIGIVQIDSALCGIPTGQIAGLLASGGTPAYTYQWFIGGFAIPAPSGTGPELDSMPAGIYNLVVTDLNQCVSATPATYTINGSSPVLAAFTSSSVSGTAPLNVTFTNGSIGATEYIWSFGNGSGASVLNPTTTYTSQGDFLVILQATNSGCSDTASITINIDQPLVLIIPNVFSPNGDNINDDFFISGAGLVSVNCDIFNRWGQRIFTIDSVDDKWSGKMQNSNEAVEGTYYYLLKFVGYDGVERTQEGFVTLLK